MIYALFSFSSMGLYYFGQFNHLPDVFWLVSNVHDEFRLASKYSINKLFKISRVFPLLFRLPADKMVYCLKRKMWNDGFHMLRFIVFSSRNPWKEGNYPYFAFIYGCLSIICVVILIGLNSLYKATHFWNSCGLNVEGKNWPLSISLYFQ